MKLCECGCGVEVTKGKNRFIWGHHIRINNPMKNSEISRKVSEAKKGRKHSDESKVKMKLCKCGCGKEVKKEGNRFIQGHYVRINNPSKNPETKVKIGVAQKGKKLSEEHKKKLSAAKKGKKHTEETRVKMSEARKGANHPLWKGGVKEKNISLYDTFVHKLVPMEKVRRHRFIEFGKADMLVRCYKCGRWFYPTYSQTQDRVRSLRSGSDGSHFYCGDECKESCAIFHKIKYPKGYFPESNRPDIDPYWRSEVIKRAKGRCERCNTKTDKLHAHHEKPATLFPMLANDIDNGWAVCEPCHYILIHGQEGCRPIDIRRIEC